MSILTTDEIWEVLDEVKDPEIPVVSVVEMGLIRSVGINDEKVIISFTPTFAGCPAFQVMRDEIQKQLEEAGAEDVEVKITYHPPWRSDWILSEGRKKLKEFGLAPPPVKGGKSVEEALSAPAVCPYCESENTTLKNSFGPTLCRSIYYCENCQQPFEQFKPI
jgi:ring-1,2-phenylacetyl-CoA epoxidase subunit PaaD